MRRIENHHQHQRPGPPPLLREHKRAKVQKEQEVPSFNSLLQEWEDSLWILGAGSFGEVRKAGVTAIKLIKNKPEYFQRELKNLQFLAQNNIPCVTKLLHHDTLGQDGILSLTYLGESLETMMEREEELHLEVIGSIAQKAFTCLEHIGKMNIIHGDLTCANICSRGVIDFGALQATPAKHLQKFTTFYVRPPEVFLNQEGTTAIDLWAMGVILFKAAINKSFIQILDDNIPLSCLHQMIDHLDEKEIPLSLIDATEKKLRDTIFDGAHLKPWEHVPQPSLREEVRARVDKKALDHKALDHDEKEQYTQVTDLILSLLHLDPKQRVSPSAALQSSFILNISI